MTLVGFGIEAGQTIFQEHWSFLRVFFCLCIHIQACKYPLCTFESQMNPPCAPWETHFVCKMWDNWKVDHVSDQQPFPIHNQKWNVTARCANFCFSWSRRVCRTSAKWVLFFYHPLFTHGTTTFVNHFMTSPLHRILTSATTATTRTLISAAITTPTTLTSTFRIHIQRSFASTSSRMSLAYTAERAQEIADNLAGVKAKLDETLQSKGASAQNVIPAVRRWIYTMHDIDPHPTLCMGLTCSPRTQSSSPALQEAGAARCPFIVWLTTLPSFSLLIDQLGHRRA